jgi:hypothetical protein
MIADFPLASISGYMILPVLDVPPGVVVARCGGSALPNKTAANL